jgi:hypothetical protein
MTKLIIYLIGCNKVERNPVTYDVIDSEGLQKSLANLGLSDKNLTFLKTDEACTCSDGKIRSWEDIHEGEGEVNYDVHDMYDSMYREYKVDNNNDVFKNATGYFGCGSCFVNVIVMEKTGSLYCHRSEITEMLI